jgi:hypothetical protein
MTIVKEWQDFWRIKRLLWLSIFLKNLRIFKDIKIFCSKNNGYQPLAGTLLFVRRVSKYTDKKQIYWYKNFNSSHQINVICQVLIKSNWILPLIF